MSELAAEIAAIEFDLYSPEDIAAGKIQHEMRLRCESLKERAMLEEADIKIECMNKVIALKPHEQTK
jgi:hypothetical protein